MVQSQSTFSPIDGEIAPLGPDRTMRKDAAIEWLRFWSCLGIVWVHMEAPGWTVAYGGLPVFVALSSGLAYRPTNTRGRSGLVRRRAMRFLLPWLFWSAVYFALHHAAGHGGADGTPTGWVALLLVGGSLHLWYLPFACVATIAVEAGSHRLGRLPRPGLTAGCAAATAVGIVASAVLTSRVTFAHTTPLAQWLFALPAVPMGLVFFRPPGQRGNDQAVTACSIVGMFAVAVGVGLLMHTDVAVPYAVAILACTLGWLMWGRSDRWSQRAGRLSFGIYLVHPMVQSILARLLGHGLGPSAVALVIPASILLVLVLLRTPLRRVM